MKGKTQAWPEVVLHVGEAVVAGKGGKLVFRSVLLFRMCQGVLSEGQILTFLLDRTAGSAITIVAGYVGSGSIRLGGAPWIRESALEKVIYLDLDPVARISSQECRSCGPAPGR